VSVSRPELLPGVRAVGNGRLEPFGLRTSDPNFRNIVKVRRSHLHNVSIVVLVDTEFLYSSQFTLSSLQAAGLASGLLHRGFWRSVPCKSRRSFGRIGLGRRIGRAGYLYWFNGVKWIQSHRRRRRLNRMRQWRFGCYYGFRYYWNLGNHEGSRKNWD
jgi:hypothetical protein